MSMSSTVEFDFLHDLSLYMHTHALKPLNLVDKGGRRGRAARGDERSSELCATITNNGSCSDGFAGEGGCEANLVLLIEVEK